MMELSEFNGAILGRLLCAFALFLVASPATQVFAGSHRHQPARHKEQPRVTAFVPVLDTTHLAAAPEPQRSLTGEINKWSNVRYRHGGTSTRGVDCSGFIYKVFEHACAINLPRNS